MVTDNFKIVLNHQIAFVFACDISKTQIQGRNISQFWYITSMGQWKQRLSISGTLSPWGLVGVVKIICNL